MVMTEINQSFTENPPSAPPFRLTESAAARIRTLLEGEPEGTRFLISVLGGGCSGFQYHFDLAVKEPEPGDIVIEQDGAAVLVEEVALPFITGGEMDYVQNLASAGFEIKNPNADAKCGCGNSFSVSGF